MLEPLEREAPLSPHVSGDGGCNAAEQSSRSFCSNGEDQGSAYSLSHSLKILQPQQSQSNHKAQNSQEVRCPA